LTKPWDKHYAALPKDRSQRATAILDLATFSAKIENNVYAFALHRMYHNFVKISGAHRRRVPPL